MPAVLTARIPLLYALALCAGALGISAPAWASGSAIVSSASESIGASIGSVSGSLKGSSKSSAQDEAVAAGDYRVVALAGVTGDADRSLLTLRATADAQREIVLELPRAAVAQGRLAPGDTVWARQRPYGVEFASAQTREAFFLLLDDDWYAELSMRALGS